MSRHLDRLRGGGRWWAAEFVLRIIGLALLGGCYKLGLLAHWTVNTPPPHQATLGEFVICTSIIFTLTSGLSLTLLGLGLFQEVPIPRSSAWYWKEL